MVIDLKHGMLLRKHRNYPNLNIRNDIHRSAYFLTKSVYVCSQ